MTPDQYKAIADTITDIHWLVFLSFLLALYTAWNAKK